MASISRALERIKQDLGEHLPQGSIEQACVDAGHHWRERQLGPVQTPHLFVLQVLNFNTAITHLRRLAGHAVNAAAYCRARMRLPLEAVQRLLGQTSQAMQAALAADDGGGPEKGIRAGKGDKYIYGRMRGRKRG
jgi:hypothetical protein